MNYTTRVNELQYLDALGLVMQHGVPSDDRTGVGTFSLFGDVNMKFDLRNTDGDAIVPMLSTKKVNFDAIKHELIWMLSGSSDVAYLKDNNVNIWDEWVIPRTAKYRMLDWDERVRKLNKEQLEKFNELKQYVTYEGYNESEILNVLEKHLNNIRIPEQTLVSGDLGPVYGAQWRQYQDTRIITTNEWSADVDGWEKRGFSVDFVSRCDKKLAISRKIDQVKAVEHTLIHNKNSRRVLLTAWNPAYVEEMALPPCHTFAQFKVTVRNGVNILDCKLYMRSADLFLGVPYNIVFYSIMTHMLCAVHGFTAGRLHVTMGDAHVYKNHVKQVRTQLLRQIKPDNHARLIIKCNDEGSILDFTADQIQIDGYSHHPFIAAPVAV